MPDIPKRVIECPKRSDHPHTKTLLFLGNNDISVYCKDHGWMKVEFHRAGELLNFKNVSVRITPYQRKGLNFIRESAPVIAEGEFIHRKKINA